VASLPVKDPSILIRYEAGWACLRADLDAVTMPEIESAFLSRPAHSRTNFLSSFYVL
jgi:hypothetical protein